MIAVVLASSMAQGRQQESPRPYLAAAIDAARWIDASAIKTERGVTWPADPKDPKSAGTTLYSGSPGVVLFMLEMHRATGDQTYVDRARLGADHLMAGIDAETETGFYTGLAGIGYTLIETANLTRESKYRDGARKAAERIRALAKPVTNGAEWSDVTDIVGGSAGTGLFLLYAAKELEEPAYRDLAARAGRRLVELARKDGPGEKWAMSPKFPRLMPNFSHGTAGISYFLATLSAETGERTFRDRAIAGARYLQHPRTATVARLARLASAAHVRRIAYAWNPFRPAGYAPRARKGLRAEADFRRAAPAAADRHAERARRAVVESRLH